METSMYLIKPEGLKRLLAIHQIISAAGLTIVNPHLVRPSYEVLQQLYPNLSEDLKVVTTEHLENKDCEIALVEGENAIARLVEVCGLFTNPSKCVAGTIRRLFGDAPINLPNGQQYYRNAIHRPQNKEEVKRDRELFGL
jgi:nucleoside diphosphate kinase